MTPDQLRRIAEAATPGEWVVGEPYDVQGASHCRCEGKGALVWEGQADINGEMMLTHVHEPSESRKSIFAYDTSIYTKTIPHAYVIALSTSEYCEISKEDAEFIATFNPQRVLEMIDELDSYRRSLRKVVDRNVELAARLAAVEEVHERREYWTETGEDICDTCSRRKQNEFVYWPCLTIKAARGE